MHLLVHSVHGERALYINGVKKTGLCPRDLALIEHFLDNNGRILPNELLALLSNGTLQIVQNFFIAYALTFGPSRSSWLRTKSRPILLLRISLATHCAKSPAAESPLRLAELAVLWRSLGSHWSLRLRGNFRDWPGGFKAARRKGGRDNRQGRRDAGGGH
jgi:hypothetical protein